MIFRPAACLAVAVMLIAAIFPMVDSYYSALRIVVAMVALMEIILTPQSNLPDSRKVVWVLAFIAMALAFNPFVPLQISRELWIGLDVLGILIFGGAAVSHITAPKEVEPVLEWRSNTKRKGLLYDPEIFKDKAADPTQPDMRPPGEAPK